MVEQPSEQQVDARREGELGLSWSLAHKDPLRLMVESVTDCAILWLDTEGYIRSWNPGAERIKGYKAEEIVGSNFSAFYTPTSIAANAPQNELRVAARVGRFEDEGWRVRKDGAQYWASVVITALRDDRGILLGFAQLTRDLSERKRTERELADANATVASVLAEANATVAAALAEANATVAAALVDANATVAAGLAKSNATVAAVLESTSDGVIQVDLSWLIVYENRRAAEKLPEYRLGRDLWVCYPELNDSDAGRSLRSSMETRAETHAEIYFAENDEWYNASAYPSEEGLSLFLRDITREKALTLELEKAQMMREKRIESLSHLAGGLAHEISNPLAIMHAAASDLKLSATDGANIPEAEIVSTCDQIVRTSERAMAILRGLKSFSREASRDPMAIASIDRIAQGCVDMQQSRFERHHIELRLTSQPGIPLILCREVQIGQIVTNLIANSFDSILAATSGERWVSINLTSAGANVCMEVADSGPGVPEELRPRLMEPFFTTKEDSGGTGIGLSLSRGIAQDHGGDLMFCEEHGRGFFRLLLPTQRESSGTRAERAAR